MAITKINSLGITNPVSFSAGTAALPSITFSGDTNTGVFAPAADTVAFTEGGTESMRIDSSGNIGIGTTSGFSGRMTISESNKVLNNRGNLNVYTTNSQAVDLGGQIGLGGLNGSGGSFDPYSFASLKGAKENSTSNNFAGYFAIGTAVAGGDITERMRIDSSGRLLLGASSIGAGMNGTFFIETDASTRNLIDANNTAAGTGSSAFIAFRRNATFTGGISNTGTSTAYNTSSDYRLKENVNYNFDATTRLKQLKPARFNFITDANKTVDGFLAHEVESIIPEAITGKKDAVQVWREGEELPEGISVGDNKLDENGNTIPLYQGIDQAKLTPILTKALQEAIAKIEQLEARLTALESK